MEYMFNNVKARNRLRALNEAPSPALPKRLPVACQRQRTSQMSRPGNRGVSLQEDKKIPRKEAALVLSSVPRRSAADGSLVQRTTQSGVIHHPQLLRPYKLSQLTPRRDTCSSCQQNQQTKANHRLVKPSRNHPVLESEETQERRACYLPQDHL